MAVLPLAVTGKEIQSQDYLNRMLAQYPRFFKFWYLPEPSIGGTAPHCLLHAVDMSIVST